MKITKIETYQVRLPLVTPFQTSYGELTTRALDIIVLTAANGLQGFGELHPFEQPDYLEETLTTAREISRKHLIPLLVKQEITHPDQVSEIFASVRGNQMAKASLETAVWDLYAKTQGKNLSYYLQHVRQDFPVGISLGIEPDLNKLKETVEAAVKNGYQRVKLKIKPGYDLAPVAFLRQHFPDLNLMVDANSAYRLSDLDHLKKLAQYKLTMIEQPFAVDDFLDHAVLQKNIQTRICLDENIRSLKDCQLANELGSCRSINLKISRVGGLSEAVKIIEFCHAHDILVWLGGMFESGVGRALNIQVAAQSALSFPPDLSASERYFYDDIIKNPLVLTKGLVERTEGLGIDVDLDFEQLAKFGHYKQLYPLV